MLDAASGVKYCSVVALWMSAGWQAGRQAACLTSIYGIYGDRIYVHVGLTVFDSLTVGVSTRERGVCVCVCVGL